MPQITVVALISDGAHVVCNNAGRPWDDFRQFVLHSILDALRLSSAIGPQVIAMTVAYHDHFHYVNSQGEAFSILSGETAQRYTEKPN